MNRIDSTNLQRVQMAVEQAQRQVPAGTAAPSFAELLRAAQAETATPEQVISQVAKLLAGGHIDPKTAVMLSLAGGDQLDLSALTDVTGVDLPTLAGRAIPAAYVQAAAPQPAGTAAQERFDMLKPHFLQAERETGVPWQIQAAQWALETGWGAATPKDSATGKESFNLFGIKGTGPAGSVDASTTEFIGGRMVQVTDRFRAYNSYTESITEHARLLTSDYYKPAHAAGKNLKAWTEALGPQNLGYATDPEYSRKLWRIIVDNGWDKP
ncbi:MAG: Mannosyl-glycoprotein endo-beta-N-acetylglucosamidase [Symbiobacteriaceae bacterium]|nr:Mannosyl-glycoprotein endo-beta-N-acetylglucosamidase [Symbiobacteriaceae bacterium]